jgi:chaperonin cofactor prefoldin
VENIRENPVAPLPPTSTPLFPSSSAYHTQLQACTMPRREPPLADQDASQGFPTDGPSPDDALLTQRLSTLDSLASQLASLRSSFRCPNYLQFQPHSTASNPVLAFSPINAPVLAYDDNLVRFLTQLDEVQSDGQLSVRNRRRELVKEVEGELGELDRLKREEFVRQINGGGLIASAEEQQARELRERKERVDGMLGSMGKSCERKRGGGC